MILWYRNLVYSSEYWNYRAYIGGPLVAEKNYNKSVFKVLSVMCSFSPKETELSAAEIYRKAGFPKTTVHRLLGTLTEIGFLEKNTIGKYRIGPRLYFLGSLYLSGTDVLKAAEPVIKLINDLTGEAVSVGILDDGNLTLVMKEQSKHAFRFAAHIGTILPAYASAMGKALLSELDQQKLDELYPEEELKPVTSKTIPTKTELKRDLDRIRSTGISLNIEGGYKGVAGIASVIRGTAGKAVAAMAISMQAHEVNDTICEKFGELMKLGSSFVSYRLGYQNAENPVRNIEEIKSWWAKYKPDLGNLSYEGTSSIILD